MLFIEWAEAWLSLPKAKEHCMEMTRQLFLFRPVSHPSMRHGVGAGTDSTQISVRNHHSLTCGL